MIVRADLPGVDPDNVEVSVTGDTLTVRGARQARGEQKGRDFLHREVSYGNFERTVTLPKGIKYRRHPGLVSKWGARVNDPHPQGIGHPQSPDRG